MYLDDSYRVEFGTQRSQVQILSRRRYKDSGTWVRESLAGATSEAFRELLGFFFAFKSFRKTLCQKKLSHEFSRDSFFYSTVTDFARLRG